MGSGWGSGEMLMGLYASHHTGQSSGYVPRVAMSIAILMSFPYLAGRYICTFGSTYSCSGSGASSLGLLGVVWYVFQPCSLDGFEAGSISGSTCLGRLRVMRDINEGLETGSDSVDIGDSVDISVDMWTSGVDSVDI